jgi:PAS domain S-box-containing protein
MNESNRALGRRVLVLDPDERESAMCRTALLSAGIDPLVCPDLAALCSEAEVGAGLLLVAEEALTSPNREMLATVLEKQPSWSDLPLLVLTQGESSERDYVTFSIFGNVTLLERPIHEPMLLSAVRAALRARERQYELRDRFSIQSLLAAIVESSDDAIVSKTLEGRILTWNGGAERMFGYTAEEAVGQSITLIIPTERHNEERDIIDRIMRGERVDDFETVRVTKDGRMLDISLSVSPIRDASNAIVGASKVARDITTQKRSERALREADRRKDEFLAMLAHELRNPLAPLRNALGLLERPETTPVTLEQLRGMMERQVDLMVRLVDDLMEVSRITRGRIELKKEVVAVSDLIRGAVETSQPLMSAANLELKIDISSEPLMLDADPVRMVQVFANLLNNATKYGAGAGEVRISARRAGDEAVVSVRDYGIGIPADMLTRVFDMFTQVDTARHDRQSGLGIGLTLVRDLVAMHGGTVTASSEGVGKGSEFTVRLPLTRMVTPSRRSAQRGKPNLPRIKILVVDDNRDSADSMSMLLESFGAEVEVAYDGTSALERVAAFQPKLVLLDLRMPGIDGFEVARKLRESPPTRHLKLVALSGWGQKEDIERSYASGFDLHLVKPASIDALRALIPRSEVASIHG